MTYPLSEDEIRRYNAAFLSYMPAGLMRDELERQGADDPIATFEALVAYYAGTDEDRRATRACFYAIEKAESLRPGPTSGELAEQLGQLQIDALPDYLVDLCRNKLMALVQEHSKLVDVTPEDVVNVVESFHEMSLGYGGDDDDDSIEPIDLTAHGDDFGDDSFLSYADEDDGSGDELESEPFDEVGDDD